jgi:hypothetical protein
MAALKTGSKVTWHWGKGSAEGAVKEVFSKPVSKVIKGKRIRRNASVEKPAYLVVQDDGDTVLKSHSELSEKS